MIEPLIPARMLNKFVYCERRGYLEMVHGEWADNEFTSEGSFVHRRVDAVQQGLPRDELPFEVRSVELTAPKLGLTGKLDLVQGQAGEAIPVEYKKGRPPATGTAPYPSDLAQLAAQALLLQENGWTVKVGYLYYSESKERREVEFTPATLAWATQQLELLRQTAHQPVAPPPLIASRKCQACSLVQICLPDEVLHLSATPTLRPEHPTRPLVAPLDNALPIYIIQNGASLGLSSERIEVRQNSEVIASFRLIDVSQVCIFGNVQISTQALRELAQRAIPVCYFSYGGWFTAIAHGHDHRNIELRRSQFRRSDDAGFCLSLARTWTASKILNCRTLLRRNGSPPPSTLSELKRLATSAENCPSLETLLGIEGLAARLYFQSFTTMFKAAGEWAQRFDQEGRNRRPPPDPINALLSYLYSLLVREFTVVAQSIGLDPYQGFYHQIRYGKPSLALDLMEEFRPLICDSVVIQLINNQVIGESDFRTYANGTTLTPTARRKILEAYERRLGQEVRHPWFDYRLSYRRIIYVQTRLLARYLMGEITNFPKFTTR